MTLQERTKAFEDLGDFLSRHVSGQMRDTEVHLHEGLNQLIEKAHIHNNWFIPNFVKEALQGLAFMLEADKLHDFVKNFPEKERLKTVAVICAGNIPMVGFHDLMCVLLSGNKLLVKLSSDDDVLPPFFLRLLVHYQPGFTDRIRYAEGKLINFDAVIATGSNNTSQHLKYYFGKYPNIIRGSRTSVAVLEGDESEKELAALGRDIFLYFGLGCRSVSKLFVPEGYNFNKFFESIVDFGFVINNKKYGNNYDYNRAIFLLESMKFLDNNFLMLMQSTDLFSPVSVLYHETYENKAALNAILQREKDRLQCIVGRNFIPFGYSQLPVISEFADGIDTLRFLVHL